MSISECLNYARNETNEALYFAYQTDNESIYEKKITGLRKSQFSSVLAYGCISFMIRGEHGIRCMLCMKCSSRNISDMAP